MCDDGPDAVELGYGSAASGSESDAAIDEDALPSDADADADVEDDGGGAPEPVIISGGAGANDDPTTRGHDPHVVPPVWRMGRVAAPQRRKKPSSRRAIIPPSTLPALQYHASADALLPRRADADRPAVPAPAPRLRAVCLLPADDDRTAERHVSFAPPPPPAPAATHAAAECPIPANASGPVTSVFELPLALNHAAADAPRSNCWWDRHAFDTAAVGIPVRHDEHTGAYHLFGVFCSWNCAIAFANDALPAHVNTRARTFINAILRAHARTSADAPMDPAAVACKPARHWALLQAYGGPLTIDAFRAPADWRAFTHVVPAWLRTVPVGYLVYQEDRTRAIGRVFTNTYGVVDEQTGRPRPLRMHGGPARRHPLGDPVGFVRPSAQQRRAPPKDPVDAVRRDPLAQKWDWEALARRTATTVAAGADEKQQPLAAPLRFRQNPLSGRRERAPQLASQDVELAVRRLQQGGQRATAAVAPHSAQNILASLASAARAQAQPAPAMPAPPPSAPPNRPPALSSAPPAPSGSCTRPQKAPQRKRPARKSSSAAANKRAATKSKRRKTRDASSDSDSSAS